MLLTAAILAMMSDTTPVTIIYRSPDNPTQVWGMDGFKVDSAGALIFKQTKGGGGFMPGTYYVQQVVSKILDYRKEPFNPLFKIIQVIPKE